MTYEEIEGILRANHFYPQKQVTVSKKQGNTVTAIMVECPAIIFMEDKKARIEEVLAAAAAKCTVSCMKNEGYILIRKA